MNTLWKRWWGSALLVAVGLCLLRPRYAWRVWQDMRRVWYPHGPLSRRDR